MADDNNAISNTKSKYDSGSSAYQESYIPAVIESTETGQQRRQRPSVSKTLNNLSEMSIECSTVTDHSQKLNSALYENEIGIDNQNKSIIEQKVKSVFELPHEEKLINEYPCYLIRWVTLPGWMYLTNSFVCFYATLPSKKHDPFKTGYLSKRKHVTSPRTHRYYFELKHHILFWSSSADTKYSPLGSIDLRYIIKIETSNHIHTLMADSEVSRREWMDELTRGVFMAQHVENRVRIILPLAKISSIDKSPIFQFTVNIRFRFCEDPTDEDKKYYFAFFPDVDEAHKHIVETWMSATGNKQPMLSTMSSDLQSTTPTAANTFASFENLFENISPTALPAMLMGKLMNVATLFQQETSNNATKKLSAMNEEEHPHSENDMEDVSLSQKSQPTATKHYSSRHKSMEIGRSLLESASLSSNTSTIASKFKRNTIFSYSKSAVADKDKISNSGSSTTSTATPIAQVNPDKEMASEHSTLTAKPSTKSSTYSLSKIPRAVTGALKHPLTSWKDSNNTESDASTTESTSKADEEKSNDQTVLDVEPVEAKIPIKIMDQTPKVAHKTRKSRTKSFGSALLSGTWNKLATGSAELLSSQQQHPSNTEAYQSHPKGQLWLNQAILNGLVDMIRLKNDTDSYSDDGRTSDYPLATTFDDEKEEVNIPNFVVGPHSAEISASNPEYEAEEQQALNERLQTAFPMLLETGIEVEAAFKCSFWRTIPYAGRIFITDKYFCFHSKILAGTQKLIVPWTDLIQISKLKAGNYYSTFCISMTIKDTTEEKGEKILFDFKTAKLRDICYAVCQLKTSCAVMFDERLGYFSSVISRESNAVSMKSVLLDRPEHVVPPKEYSGPPLLASSSYLINTSTKHKRPEGPLHITCLTIGSRGDVQPYVALCKELQKDGHRCRIATHPEYEKWIRQHDIEFKSVGGDPGELMFYSWFKSLLETAYEACKGTDVLIESPSAMVGIHMAEKLQIAYFRSMPFPFSRTTKFPHPFAIQPSTTVPGGRIYNDMTYMMIDMALWAGTAKQINRFRHKVLHLPSTTLDELELYKVPYIYSFSPAVVHPPKDWPDYIHCTGYWFLDNPDISWKPDYSLLEFLNQPNDNRPIVYIGFGSIIVPNAVETTRIIIDSVLNANVRAIICKGWSARGTSTEAAPSSSTAAISRKFRKTHRKTKSLDTDNDNLIQQQQQQQQEEEQALRAQDKASDILLDKYPGTIYQLDSVPHDWLFPKIQGVVHHGGAGTTAAGLRAGLPTIVKPFFGDQRFWGQRIEELQIGVCLNKLAKAPLTDALTEITQNQAMITKAQLIGETIRKENGPRNAVNCIYREYEFAKQQRTRSYD
ncbi:hypothetical protein BDF20DRAFT_834938 [Mycotypha africana]|uniref:uncharacterized protein n=1 Tax=Mycotypha africana TaxID=64632 RepID=UPI0022FFD6A9|nr:uncharacterized protein BDF20DRAFT_834938 [Mycotypha africana]KAI8982303.1 hypothetical protein BDF20DRAFT_834938 [Mycotypha africana]